MLNSIAFHLSLIHILEEEGLMENTVIVLYGDNDARLPKADFSRLFNYDKETDGLIPEDDPNFVRLDAETERRRNLRPRGGNRQDADNVHRRA